MTVDACGELPAPAVPQEIAFRRLLASTERALESVAADGGNDAAPSTSFDPRAAKLKHVRLHIYHLPIFTMRAYLWADLQNGARCDGRSWKSALHACCFGCMVVLGMQALPSSHSHKLCLVCSQKSD